MTALIIHEYCIYVIFNLFWWPLIAFNEVLKFCEYLEYFCYIFLTLYFDGTVNSIFHYIYRLFFVGRRKCNLSLCIYILYSTLLRTSSNSKNLIIGSFELFTYVIILSFNSMLLFLLLFWYILSCFFFFSS